MSQDEFDFLKGYEFLTPDDILQLIDNRKLFEKYCRIRIRQIDIDLANMKYVKREQQAYDYMDSIRNLMEGISKQINEYKQYTKKLEEKKEEKKDERPESEKQKDREQRKIKRKYKI